jgi:hypothetical protein
MYRDVGFLRLVSLFVCYWGNSIKSLLLVHVRCFIQNGIRQVGTGCLMCVVEAMDSWGNRRNKLEVSGSRAACVRLQCAAGKMTGARRAQNHITSKNHTQTNKANRIT